MKNGLCLSRKHLSHNNASTLDFKTDIVVGVIGGFNIVQNIYYFKTMIDVGAESRSLFLRFFGVTSAEKSSAPP